MATVTRNSLAIKNVGNGKLGAVLKNDGDKVLIGTVSGIASGIKRGKMPDGVTPTIGLTGDFEGMPADAAADTVRSGVCYLPEGLQNPIIAALTDEVNSEGRVLREGAKSVMFAYEVYSVKAGNAAGFTWEFKSAMPIAENDPLAELRGKLLAMRTEQPKIEAAKK